MGAALVVTSAVLFSFSGVLTKAIDAGSWTILGWRGVVGGAGIAGDVWYRERHQALRTAFRLGRHGWLLATVGGIGSITFIFAFKNTYVANVLVIYATIPFIAALLERGIVGNTVRRRTLGAATASIALGQRHGSLISIERGRRRSAARYVRHQPVAILDSYRPALIDPEAAIGVNPNLDIPVLLRTRTRRADRHRSDPARILGPSSDVEVDPLTQHTMERPAMRGPVPSEQQILQHHSSLAQDVT